MMILSRASRNGSRDGRQGGRGTDAPPAVSVRSGGGRPVVVVVVFKRDRRDDGDHRRAVVPEPRDGRRVDRFRLVASSSVLRALQLALTVEPVRRYRLRKTVNLKSASIRIGAVRENGHLRRGYLFVRLFVCVFI